MTDTRAQREWRQRERAEYRSAAITARVLHWMLQCGLPTPLLLTGHRIVRDELDHAELSRATWQALGAGEMAVAYDVAELDLPMAAEGPLASLLDGTLRAFCIGETLAVPLFDAMLRRAAVPAAAIALRRIAADERVHRAFGWTVLGAIQEQDPQGTAARVEATLPAVLTGFRAAYAQAAPGPPLTEQERDAGLLDAADYRSIFYRCLDEDIRPRLQRLSLPTSAVEEMLADHAPDTSLPSDEQSTPPVERDERVR